MTSRTTITRWLGRGTAAIIATVYLSPVLYIFVSSFQPATAILNVSGLQQSTFTIRAYLSVIGNTTFDHTVLNSLVVTAGTMVATLVLGSAAAYAVTRLRVGEWIANWVLLARMVPAITLILPFFIFYREFDILDTRVGLIAAYTAFNLPMVTWLLIGFFGAIPVEYEEAASIDGASIPQLVAQILWPLARPGIAATALLTSIYCWNEFLLALVLTTSDAQTAPVAISRFVSERSIEWSELGAAGVLISLPVIVLALAMRRHLVQGLSGGQLK
jgi:multiple sugar transport system permease protein